MNKNLHGRRRMLEGGRVLFVGIVFVIGIFGVQGEGPSVVRQDACILRLRNSAMHAAIEARGGAVSPTDTPPTKKKKTTTKKKKKTGTSTKSKKSSSTKSKKKRSTYPYDDDDEDDDEFMGGKRRQELSYYKPRTKARTGPTVWQRATVMAKAAAEQAVEKSKVAAGKAKELGVEAAQRAQKAQRLAKAYYSSEYEKFLLTATWPSDQGVPPQLTKRLVESVARFPTRPASLPEDDPYRVTLRKLWKKMVEQDWRTSMKSLYLLHALSREAPVSKARALSRTLKAMLTDLDPKSGRKYFNRRDLVVKKVQEDRARLVDAYAGLVLRRTLLFAGADFHDVAKSPELESGVAPQDAAGVKLISRRAQHALLVLEHAVQFIEVARTGPDGKAIKPSNAHLVIVSCLDLVLQDLAGAFKLAAESISMLASIADSDISLSPTTTSDVQKVLEKFNSLRPRLTKAAKTAVKALRYFDNKVNLNFLTAEGVADEETIQLAIEVWEKRPATAPDDEDDDDLADDDDDDEFDDDDDDDFDDDDDENDSDDDDF